MSKTVVAIYEGGVFRPLQTVNLVDGTRIRIELPEPGADVPFISHPQPTDEEFDRLLGELASGPSVPTLPADFSRADIYDDHD